MAVGFAFLVTGVLGYRASFKTEDEDKKNKSVLAFGLMRQWLFGTVGFVGSLMMVVVAVHFACWAPAQKSQKSHHDEAFNKTLLEQYKYF